MPAPYRLAIFDFDGTLADSFALFSEAFNALAPRHGFRPVTPADAAPLRAMHARDVMRHVGMPPWKLPIVGKECMGIVRARRQDGRLFPGAADMLANVRAGGCHIAIVSS